MLICPKCLNYGFENPLEAWDRHGLCLLHSKEVDKKDFFTALIDEKKKLKDFNFSGVFFPGDVSFRGFNFTKEAHFTGATFDGNANFYGARFDKSAYFQEATFVGTVAFRRAVFSKNFSIRGATFYGVANFSDSAFDGIADFSAIRLKVKAKLQFSGINVETRSGKLRKYKPWRGYFNSMRVSPEATLIFQDSNLSRASFLETDLTRIEFDSVTWASRWGRAAIYNELLWREKKEGSIESVERLYRQLKSNYEDKKDYKRVGDFHYGEMEMHRIGGFWRRRFPFSWYNLYWALNGYGERPLRAFIWFGVFLLSFTGALYWLGVNLVSSGNPASLAEIFRFVIDKATLQRPEWARPIPELGNWVAASSILIIPGQLALFFLALRNRLGRRR